MPTIEFTSHLAQHLDCDAQSVEADSLSEALHAVFERYPRLRGYLLDDQDCIRKHVSIFVDNHMLRDRQSWDVPLRPDSVVYVMQALSGG